MNEKLHIPRSRAHIAMVLKQALSTAFDDPVVELQDPDTGHIRIRVGQGEREPKYFNVKVTEERL